MTQNDKNGYALIIVLIVILILGLLAGGLYFDRVNNTNKIKKQSTGQAKELERQVEDQMKKLELKTKNNSQN